MVPQKTISDEFLSILEKIEIILNGIDVEKFVPNENVTQLNYKLITTASADIPLKGLKYLIKALPKILEVFPSASLDVIGKSPTDSDVRKLIQDLNLEDKITFYSGVSEDEIIQLYHESSVAVIPSLYEGFGFGAGEAMACGVPLVSTHSGGRKDVVGDCALKIQPKFSEEIEKGCDDLYFRTLNKEKSLLKKEERGWRSFSDWKIAAKSYVAVFQEVIESFNNEHTKYKDLNLQEGRNFRYGVARADTQLRPDWNISKHKLLITVSRMFRQQRKKGSMISI